MKGKTKRKTGAQYVALLRGINVGGHSLIKMADLKTCCEQLGLEEVATYIASGNVLFRSSKAPSTLETLIERGLTERFRYPARVVVVSRGELLKVIKGAPRGFGREPAAYRYDVIFLKKPLKASEILKQVRLNEGVDTASAGAGVLYCSRLIKLAAKSYLSKIIRLPAYPSLTIRNWNTATTLLALMDAAPEDDKGGAASIG